MPYSKTYVTQNTPEHKNLGIYNKCTLRVHVDVHLLSFIFLPILPSHVLFTKKHLRIISVHNIKSSANEFNCVLNNK